MNILITGKITDYSGKHIPRHQLSTMLENYNIGKSSDKQLHIVECKTQYDVNLKVDIFVYADTGIHGRTEKVRLVDDANRWRSKKIKIITPQEFFKLFEEEKIEGWVEGCLMDLSL
jgi:EAL domain-containing protein (putative c-di-GMP-specific phosphodiesterase class I)